MEKRSDAKAAGSSVVALTNEEKFASLQKYYNNTLSNKFL